MSIFVVGTRRVEHLPKSNKHGAYVVTGATSGNIMQRFPYDERPMCAPADIKAHPSLRKLIVGRKREVAKQLAIQKAVDNSAVCRGEDR